MCESNGETEYYQHITKWDKFKIFWSAPSNVGMYVCPFETNGYIDRQKMQRKDVSR